MTLLDPRSGQESLGPALPFVNTRSWKYKWLFRWRASDWLS
jgi:hypothetical protein